MQLEPTVSGEPGIPPHTGLAVRLENVGPNGQATPLPGYPTGTWLGTVVVPPLPSDDYYLQFECYSDLVGPSAAFVVPAQLGGARGVLNDPLVVVGVTTQSYLQYVLNVLGQAPLTPGTTPRVPSTAPPSTTTQPPTTTTTTVPCNPRLHRGPCP